MTRRWSRISGARTSGPGAVPIPGLSTRSSPRPEGSGSSHASSPGKRSNCIMMAPLKSNSFRLTITGPPNTQRPREHLRPSSPRVTALSTMTGASTHLFPRSPPPLRTSVPHATQQAVHCVFHRPSSVSIAGSTISATMTISVPGFDAASPRVLPWCPTFTRRFQPCSPVSHRSTMARVSVPQAVRTPVQSAGPGLPVTVSTRRLRRSSPDRILSHRPLPQSTSEHAYLLDSRLVPNAFPVWQAAPFPLPFPHDQHPIASTSRTPNSTLLQSSNDCFGNL